MTTKLGHVRRARGVLAVAVVLLPAVLMVRATAALSDATPVPRTPAAEVQHTAAECSDLIKQFDVAFPTHKEAKRAAEAQQSRDQGAQACGARNYADGVKALHRALHYIGVKPVQLVPSGRA